MKQLPKMAERELDRTPLTEALSEGKGDLFMGLQVVTVRKLAVQAPPLYERGFTGPFPPEMVNHVEVKRDADEGDSLHAALDHTRMFLCHGCNEILDGTDLYDHNCSDYIGSSSGIGER